MNYATSYYIGSNIPARKTKATAVTPPVRRICQLDEADKGHQRDAQRQTQVNTNNTTANGFLRATFLPRLKTEQSLQACTRSDKTENDFYASLSSLATHYSIEFMQTRGFGYPYNLALALWDVESQLKNKVANWDAVQLVQDKKKIFILSEERYRTGTSLYYIPVIPIFRMLKDRQRKRTAYLLLSVCCYLYHNADIPYYRQENSYLYWQYDMLKEWMEEDEESKNYAREFHQAEWVGDYMEQKIFNLSNLTVFKERLNRFKSRDEFDRNCHELAREAFEIFTQYPNESVFRNASQEDDPEEEQESITMVKYISFWADDKGWLSQNLTDCINNEFNEYGQMEEPTIRKMFGKNPVKQGSLDFESRLFPVLDKLCFLLNNY